MSHKLRTHPTGGYLYLPGPPTFSLGVMAEAGYRLERARIATPAPIGLALDFIVEYLKALGRPSTALAAIELRTTQAPDPTAFAVFNNDYATRLHDNGLVEDEIFSVARSNVCAAKAGSAEPLVAAFTYTLPGNETSQGFVISGAAETRPGVGSFEDRIVAYQDLSDAGLRLKCLHVLEQIEQRLAALGKRWRDVSVTQIYTELSVYPFIFNELGSRGADGNGVGWVVSRPPIKSLEFEMDCRRTTVERLISM